MRRHVAVLVDLQLLQHLLTLDQQVHRQLRVRVLQDVQQTLHLAQLGSLLVAGVLDHSFDRLDVLTQLRKKYDSNQKQQQTDKVGTETAIIWYTRLTSMIWRSNFCLSKSPKQMVAAVT